MDAPHGIACWVVAGLQTGQERRRIVPGDRCKRDALPTLGLQHYTLNPRAVILAVKAHAPAVQKQHRGDRAFQRRYDRNLLAGFGGKTGKSAATSIIVEFCCSSCDPLWIQ